VPEKWPRMNRYSQANLTVLMAWGVALLLTVGAGAQDLDPDDAIMESRPLLPQGAFDAPRETPENGSPAPLGWKIESGEWRNLRPRCRTFAGRRFGAQGAARAGAADAGVRPGARRGRPAHDYGSGDGAGPRRGARHATVGRPGRCPPRGPPPKDPWRRRDVDPLHAGRDRGPARGAMAGPGVGDGNLGRRSRMVGRSANHGQLPADAVRADTRFSPRRNVRPRPISCRSRPGSAC